jgi:hypothetical protein
MSTLRTVVAESLRKAGTTYNERSQAAPAAVFWADPDRLWESAIKQLQEAIPILVLGEYDPEKASYQAQGPALWLRAAVSKPNTVKLPQYLAFHSEKNPWVIYLPGVRCSDFTQPTEMPEALTPLADLETRSVWWRSTPPGIPWTPHSFLGNKEGAALNLKGDKTTIAAVEASLTTLLDENYEQLQSRGQLDAQRINALTMPDPIKLLLDWIDDPHSIESLDAPARKALTAEAKKTYELSLTKDTPISAAEKLGKREGAWKHVWDRYADKPNRFPNIRTALDKARPSAGATLFTDTDTDPFPDSWPSWNKEQEDDLRHTLSGFSKLNNANTAVSKLSKLVNTHAPRLDNVWAELGEAPLAAVVTTLFKLANAVSTYPSPRNIVEFAAWYAKSGYLADRLAIEALGSVKGDDNIGAVRAVLQTLYDPWAAEIAKAFQDHAKKEYPAAIGLETEPGTCVLFVDALRYDLAIRLAERLTGHETTIEHRLAAFPSITPTGQPAVAPAGFEDWGRGPDFYAGDEQGRAIKGEVFRNSMANHGIQYLQWKDNEIGDTSGRAWTQTNIIDDDGHNDTDPYRLTTNVSDHLNRVADRVRSLLASGWRTVVIVTDHGFLLPGGPAEKAALAKHLTEGEVARKPRCARLATTATAPNNYPVVPWTWDTNISMVSAPSTAAFEANTIYTHGGLSPQECVTPVLTITSGGGQSSGGVKITAIEWKGQAVNVAFEPAEAPVEIELRRAAGDVGSVVGGPKKPRSPGLARLMADDDTPGTEAGTNIIIVLVDTNGSILAQQETTVGGNQ